MFEKPHSVNPGKKILIIGLGQIGHSNAEYMTSLGLHVDGYDINKEAITRALHDKVIQKSATNFQGYDYYVICISTHRPEDMFVPYLDGMLEIAKRLSHEGKTGALVGIDSTVTRGTTQEIKKILGHRLHVVHVPHRFFVHEKEDHGVRQIRVIGGCESCCIQEGKYFYGNLLQIPLHPVSSPDIAEITKVVENSYRYLEIAFAEELKMVCDNISINFDELREAINTKWNIEILNARDGIGGHCLPKDSQMFLDFSRNSVVTSMVRVAKMVDSQYRFHLTLQNKQEMPLARVGSV
jgi:UDP-N-acetyl-D-mannosaminuronic acid dehydrogenase